MSANSRALIVAPLAIFPVALIFVAARSILAGDLRELFAAPFSASLITFSGYPIAFALGWLFLRTLPRFVNASAGLFLLAGVASAEVAFWLLIHPFWQREFSNLFCAALVAACTLATAGSFQLIKPKLASTT